MIISIDKEKAFGKPQQCVMIKTMKKTGMKRLYLNMVKAIYEKPIDSIILSEEKLKLFSLKSGTRKLHPL